MHALIAGWYLWSGSWYPVGGSAAFTNHITPTITKNGGETRAGVRVEMLLFEGETVVGVRTAEGTEIRANAVISDIGVRETIDNLLPEDAGTKTGSQKSARCRPASRISRCSSAFKATSRPPAPQRQTTGSSQPDRPMRSGRRLRTANRLAWPPRLGRSKIRSTTQVRSRSTWASSSFARTGTRSRNGRINPPENAAKATPISNAGSKTR